MQTRRASAERSLKSVSQVAEGASPCGRSISAERLVAGTARSRRRREKEKAQEKERESQSVACLQRRGEAAGPRPRCSPRGDFLPGDSYEPPLHHEMRMPHPGVALAPPPRVTFEPPSARPGLTRSKSERELRRRLSESLDMQERLAADNAELDGKRYVLYKELMSKEQRLETARVSAARLQAELKILARDNSRLRQALQAYQSASAVNTETTPDQLRPTDSEDSQAAGDTGELVHLVTSLEEEVLKVKSEMDAMKGNNACRGGGGQNTCFQAPPGAPPAPPMSRACGVCPPCPAPCNPDGPPTPAEREAGRLSVQLKQTEDSFKTKVTECAMLRAELMKRKEELEKERCMLREAQGKLRELEMRFEGLATHTNMMMGTKEQAFEQEVSVRALKQCYREAREEVDELRALLAEQGEQLQDYRVKYLQAQQLSEEQKRQLAAMDMDNTRIAEQINLEIQRVKIKFQEKLQELSPVPALLQATQRKLQDAQQAQALAEHRSEQLARELNTAREKVHMLLHNSLKPPAEKQPDRGGDEKQLALAQQRITQLTETNQQLKQDVERLKSSQIRMEEAVLANERRLQEKMHECAALGGELDRARDEAARAVHRANQRTDTIRKCMQTTVAELERQLAASRGQVNSAEKEREELQSRMQCQIKRLNENFEQAQLRVLGLQSQVQALRRTASSTGEGDNDDNQECACKSFFEE